MTHGLRSTYVNGCKCAPCRAANTRYAKLAKYRADKGISLLVDASVVREHLEELRRAGVGRRTIAARAGVANTVVNRLLGVDRNRPAKRVRPETAAKLLAVTPGDAALQPTLGTSRRLQALVAIGYTQTALAQRIGWTPSNFTTLIHARHPYVHHTTATAVDKLYQELSGTPGGNRGAQAIARRHGWMPPLAWDDIDNPDERAKGRRPTGESVNCLDVLELYEAGNNIAHIAGRLGISENSVHTYLSRARKAAS